MGKNGPGWPGRNSLDDRWPICSKLDYGMNTFCVAVTEPLVTLTI